MLDLACLRSNPGSNLTNLATTSARSASLADVAQPFGDAVDVMRRLLTIAEDPSDTNQRARLTALYLLSRAYRGDWFRIDTLRNYYAVEDRFAMRRASDSTNGPIASASSARLTVP